MTAQSMHPARGSTPSRGFRLRYRLRVARAFSMLFVACALAAACHDDESATLSQTGDAPPARSSAAPLAQAVTAPAATIAILASPARPLKQAGMSTSPADAPLAPPVIHTVD